MKEPSAILIGTSGWHYAHWKGLFYPEEVPTAEYLEYYARHFRTAEVNNTFYHMPQKKTFDAWRDTVDDGFVFAVKASRYITHMKKLKDAAKPVSRFMELTENLGDKLGPVLFQLPPHWGVDPKRLEEFLGLLPRGPKYTFEFRDPSWFDPSIYALLADHGAAFCMYDLQGHASPKEVTADFIYVRLHGPAAAYQGSYPDETLAGWAGAFSTWSAGGKRIYCYFNNDQEGFAVENALRLRQMLAGD